MERRAEDSRLEEIAARAAKQALTDLFEVLGADISTADGRKAVRENWTWLNDTRAGTAFIRKTTIGAVFAALVGGLAWLLSKGLAVVASLGVR
jgi:hypothetical protein